MDKERAIVGWSGGKTGAVRGSVQFPCSACSGPVWLAPSGQKERERGAAVLCVPCAFRAMVAGGSKVIELETAPGAIEEFIEEIQNRAERN
jgi:hypothetical protein